jgi:enamine deaminase RidA (YjgF/YER057c/UK114 family)
MKPGTTPNHLHRNPDATVFGDAGRHTRSAVGLAELPFDIAVEIELIARLRSD